MSIRDHKFNEILEQLDALEDEIRNCVDTGILRLDLTGARTPSLLVALAAKLVVEHCKREERLKSIDILQGISGFAEQMRLWGLHFGREAQRQALKKEQEK